jgi:hypothetical protein
MGIKRDAFVRLANNRVNRAIESIRLIGNLSNRANYEFTEEDVEAIIDSLRKAVSDCKKKFELSDRQASSSKFKIS